MSSSVRWSASSRKPTGCSGKDSLRYGGAAGTLAATPRFIVSKACYDSGDPLQVASMTFHDEKEVAEHLMTEYQSEAEDFGWSKKTVKVKPGDIREGYTVRSPGDSESHEYVWLVTEINNKP